MKPEGQSWSKSIHNLWFQYRLKYPAGISHTLKCQEYILVTFVGTIQYSQYEEPLLQMKAWTNLNTEESVLEKKGTNAP